MINHQTNSVPNPLKTKHLPSTEYLRECFLYLPEKGTLIWRVRPRSHFNTNRGCSVANSQFSGKEAGVKNFRKDGKRLGISVCIMGISYLAHRIIMTMNGLKLSLSDLVDHRDVDPFNNRLENLRIATNEQNHWNAPKRKHAGKVNNLPKGVSRNKNRFMAKAQFNGKEFYLGNFKTPEQAHEAYCSFAIKHRGEFARAK